MVYEASSSEKAGEAYAFGREYSEGVKQGLLTLDGAGSRTENKKLLPKVHSETS